jgi:hypothetical protein
VAARTAVQAHLLLSRSAQIASCTVTRRNNESLSDKCSSSFLLAVLRVMCAVVLNSSRTARPRNKTKLCQLLCCPEANAPSSLLHACCIGLLLNAVLVCSKPQPVCSPNSCSCNWHSG